MIPGIAQTTALAVLAEIEKVEKFLSARQLAAYIGLTPKHQESGISVHFKPSISKIDSPILRKALYFPAVTAIRCDKTFAKFAQKLEARKKSGKQIIVAIMRNEKNDPRYLWSFKK
jgi:transposase